MNSTNAELPPPSKFGPKSFVAWFRGPSFKPTWILLYAAFALALWAYIPPAPCPSDAVERLAKIDRIKNSSADRSATSSADRSVTSLSAEQPAPHAFFIGEKKIFAAFVLFFLVPAGMVKFLFREHLTDYGLGWGNRFTLRSILIFTPLLIFIGAAASINGRFFTVYPYNPTVTVCDRYFWAHAILYLLCYYTAWEFMFRGFLLRGLAPSCGFVNAVLISALATSLLHIGHPLSETLGTIGGSIFWGFLALRTRSILSGTVQHAASGITLEYFLLMSLTK